MSERKALHVEPLDPLLEVRRIVPALHEDARGATFEAFRESALAAHGILARFVQATTTRNGPKGVLRGLHVQGEPAPQGKLVRVSRGMAFDVVVDVRPESPTYGRHVTDVLSEANGRMLWVPPGFAHGYATLVENTTFEYLFEGHEFQAEHVRTVRWDDPALNIGWPVADPLLAPRDAAAPTLAEAFPRSVKA